MRNICYKPTLASTGHKRLAEAAVFAGSAALHWFPVALLGGSTWARRSTAAFFAVQPAIIALERALHLRGFLWVQLVGWATAPLFALPLLEVM